MKFALFATTAVAASLVQRDAATLEADVAAIVSATANLDKAIKAITGPESKNSVLSANAAVLSAINKGITDAKATSQLTTLEGAGLAQPIIGLSTQVKTTIDDLVAKKSIIVGAGLGATTEDQLTQVQSASSTFASDLTAIVSTDLKSTAQSLSASILGSLASGVAAFKNTGSGSSASATSAPATSAPASSAPASSAPASSAPASSGSSAVSSVSSAVSSAVSSVASSASSTYPTGASNSTSSSTPSGTPYTGAAVNTVASLGGLVAAAVAVVAAL